MCVGVVQQTPRVCINIIIIIICGIIFFFQITCLSSFQDSTSSSNCKMRQITSVNMRHRIYSSSHTNQEEAKAGKKQSNHQIIQCLNLGASHLYCTYPHCSHFGLLNLGELFFQVLSLEKQSPPPALRRIRTEKKWHFNQELTNLQSHITSLSTKITTSKVIPSSRAESASDFSSELSSGFISS